MSNVVARGEKRRWETQTRLKQHHFVFAKGQIGCVVLSSCLSSWEHVVSPTRVTNDGKVGSIVGIIVLILDDNLVVSFASTHRWPKIKSVERLHKKSVVLRTKWASRWIPWVHCCWLRQRKLWTSCVTTPRQSEFVCLRTLCERVPTLDGRCDRNQCFCPICYWCTSAIGSSSEICRDATMQSHSNIDALTDRHCPDKVNDDGHSGEIKKISDKNEHALHDRRDMFRTERFVRNVTQAIVGATKTIGWQGFLSVCQGTIPRMLALSPQVQKGTGGSCQRDGIETVSHGDQVFTSVKWLFTGLDMMLTHMWSASTGCPHSIFVIGVRFFLLGHISRLFSNLHLRGRRCCTVGRVQGVVELQYVKKVPSRCNSGRSRDFFMQRHQ